MTTSVVYALREALLLALLLAAPPVGAALAVGVVGGVVQSATRFRDPTVGWAPKAIAALGALLVASPWIAAHMLRFTQAMLEAMSAWARAS